MMLFADAALARRLEDAEARGTVEYAQAQARLRPEAGTAEVPVAGGYAVYAGLGSPLSRAVGLGLNGPIQAADLEQVEDFYHGRGAPAAVDLCPLADSSLRELLGRRGYRPAEFNNVWVRPVNEAESWSAPPPPFGSAGSKPLCSAPDWPLPPEPGATWRRCRPSRAAPPSATWSGWAFASRTQS